ncbi:putative ABC transport system permease protein [Mucilaginibacter frigoritolerans]|uniref:Putative ABC transport system permease protein n=1 Tax=Mucilaginibacter frigoritolerans TaxID=652788 RepID=A0A562UF22_9SPHI|nr:ABC transporter permease [Mucilaginibacter frigoritolerans]TWJ04396.1 putative ABC transport system permease protein [Mucilaginibacter frigoritolerans]
MLKSYLKTAFRFLLKNKTFSFINIFGLATGTLCCLYILLYVQDQYSYDKQHNSVKNIYRLTTDLVLSGDKHHSATSSPPIAPALKKDFPEVQNVTRVVEVDKLGAKEHLLRYKEKSFYESEAYLVDSTFFDMFNYNFVEGHATHALDDPYSVVLLKTTADKLFGSENAVGKMININDAYGKHDFKVTGVVDESLGKSHLHANMFITMKSSSTGVSIANDNEWAGNNFLFTYVKLRPGADPKTLEKKLPAFLLKYASQKLKQLGMQKELHLQPVTSIHTTAGFDIEPTKTANPSFLLILVLIAVLIQVIACINFMNLSTARASKRAKEVGVRKVVGAGKYDLIKQFLGESFILSFIGVIIALPLLWIVLPYFNDITHADIRLSFFADYRLWLILTALIVVTGLVAGSYPAFYLSAFEAIKVIKGNFNSRISAIGIRKILVIIQFVVSIVMITCIIIIYSQLSFIKNKDLGFDKNQKVIFNFYTDDAQKQMPALANDLRQIAGVKAVNSADNYLSQFVMHDHGVYPAGGNMATAIDAQNIASDQYFIKAYGIKLLSGRDFIPGDSNKVIINTTLAKRLNLNAQTAPGARLYSQFGNGPLTFVTVVGVMNDFNYNSLHDAVRPFMVEYDGNAGDMSSIIVSTNSKDYKALLTQIGAIWHKDLPSVPFEYSFMDSEVQKQYETEITLSNIINSFTIIAILISCLGLFGLAAFSAEQRNKEIGIRKVLGASVSGLVSLLSKDFLILVGVSFVIATPMAWYGMSKWLEAFAYRISLSWWMFALAGVMAVLIAVLTVSTQAIRAALANPVKSLKTE